MTDESTLLEIQLELSNLMTDLEKRITKVYDKYLENAQVPKLPPYEKLRDDKVRYECSKTLTDGIDELTEMKLRVGLLKRSFMKYRNFQPSSKTEYNIAKSFRSSLDEKISVLEEYSIEISTIIRNANSKLNVLGSAQFFDV